MYASALLATAFFGMGMAQLATQPKDQTFGALYTPDGSHPATRGQTISVTWDPTGHTTDGSTVSLVLCRGGSGNCVTDTTAIVTGVPAKNAQYTWSVPCSLPVGVQSTATGYGMLIIVDGTGQFQYSTQFSVLEGTTCGSSTSSSSSSSVVSSSSTSSASSGSSSTGSSSSVSSTKTTSKPASTSSGWTNYSTPVLVTSTGTPNWSPIPQPTPAAVTTTSATASSTTPVASPSQFKGAATRLGSSAAALAMAAGAAFVAL